jgi:hypothetical protein
MQSVGLELSFQSCGAADEVQQLRNLGEARFLKRRETMNPAGELT